MVGFIGQQKLLSSNAGGAFVESYQLIALDDGTLLNAYFPQASSDLAFYAIAGPRATPEQIGSFAGNGAFGSSALRMKDASVFPMAGGFGLVIDKPTADATTAQRALFQRFGADGAPRGDEVEIATGRFDDLKAFALSNGGFLVRYHDEDVEGSFVGEKRIVFYDARGREVATRVLEPGSSFDSTGLPEAATLDNGNVALVWSAQAGGLSTQVFRPDGRPVGEAQAVPGAPSTIHEAITALPGGGYLVGWYDRTDRAIVLQKLGNDATPRGAEIRVPTLIDGAGGARETGVALSITEGGLIAVAWEGDELTGRTAFDALGDVYLAVLTQDGVLVTGPEVASDPRLETQSDPQFVTFPDGSQLLGFFDNDFVPFSYQDSVQGTYLTSPDTIWTGDGRDNRNGGTGGEDILLGLGGDDTLSGGDKGDLLRGGAGDDRLSGGDSGDELIGEAGDDRLEGQNGDDTLGGATGVDELDGGKGDDVMDGGDGKDSLEGGSGDDTGFGGEGDDLLLGGKGADLMQGQGGDDTARGGGGNDSVTGGEGRDLVRGDGGNDRLEGDAGRDTLRGGAGDDILRGGDDADLVRGEGGDDIIFSDAGNDKEKGGGGDDTLYDSDGNDRMWGEAGADTFLFQDTIFGKDKIQDFEVGVDTLDMGTLARALALSGGGEIRVREVSAGTRFSVDGDNWVLVKGVGLSDFAEGDYIITDPFA